MNPHRRVPNVRSVAAALLAAGLLAGCGGEETEPVVSGSTEGSGQLSSGNVVSIKESRFGPERLVVAPGTEVTFENLDPFAHTVTAASDSGLDFDSGDLLQSETFVQEFDTAGSFAYFCEIHPTMRAEVTVRRP